jgi:hypothetical protein
MLGHVTAWEASLGKVRTDSARFVQVRPCYVRLGHVSTGEYSLCHARTC